MKTIGELLDEAVAATLKNRGARLFENDDPVYLQEKEKQVSLTSTNKASESDTGESKKQPVDDDDNDQKALAEAPDLDQIIEKLNLIRSGKSLKDSIIQHRFKSYYDDLSDAERVALFAYLKGIAQIVNGDIEPDLAQEPADDPANIHMHKLKGKKLQQVKRDQKRTIKPSISSGGSQSKSAEDSSGPVVVKKSQ